MKGRPARAKMFAEPFEKFMAILHSVSHCAWGWDIFAGSRRPALACATWL